MVSSNSGRFSFLAQSCSKAMKSRWPFTEFVLLFVLLPLVGCGGNSEDTHPVTGRVTLDDQSLAEAQVEFFPVAEGSSASAFTDENGNYELVFTVDQKRAPVGKYTCRFLKSKTHPKVT